MECYNSIVFGVFTVLLVVLNQSDLVSCVSTTQSVPANKIDEFKRIYHRWDDDYKARKNDANPIEVKTTFDDLMKYCPPIVHLMGEKYLKIIICIIYFMIHPFFTRSLSPVVWYLLVQFVMRVCASWNLQPFEMWRRLEKNHQQIHFHLCSKFFCARLLTASFHAAIFDVTYPYYRDGESLAILFQRIKSEKMLTVGVAT